MEADLPFVGVKYIIPIEIATGRTLCLTCRDTVPMSAAAQARIRQWSVRCEGAQAFPDLSPQTDAARHARLDELSPGWREDYKQTYGHFPGEQP